MPLILSRLTRAVFISSIDLKDAYWQIPLKESAREKRFFQFRADFSNGSLLSCLY